MRTGITRGELPAAASASSAPSAVARLWKTIGPEMGDSRTRAINNKKLGQILALGDLG